MINICYKPLGCSIAVCTIRAPDQGVCKRLLADVCGCNAIIINSGVTCKMAVLALFINRKFVHLNGPVYMDKSSPPKETHEKLIFLFSMYMLGLIIWALGMRY